MVAPLDELLPAAGVAGMNVVVGMRAVLRVAKVKTSCVVVVKVEGGSVEEQLVNSSGEQTSHVGHRKLEEHPSSSSTNTGPEEGKLTQGWQINEICVASVKVLFDGQGEPPRNCMVTALSIATTVELAMPNDIGGLELKHTPTFA